MRAAYLPAGGARPDAYKHLYAGVAVNPTGAIVPGCRFVCRARRGRSGRIDNTPCAPHDVTNTWADVFVQGFSFASEQLRTTSYKVAGVSFVSMPRRFAKLHQAAFIVTLPFFFYFYDYFVTISLSLYKLPEGKKERRWQVVT